MPPTTANPSVVAPMCRAIVLIRMRLTILPGRQLMQPKVADA
jgi:hypothetical protein